MHSPTNIQKLFAHPKPIIGVVHLLPLVGSPRWKGNFEEVAERAISDALSLAKNGIDGILMENYGDAPFLPGPAEPHTVAMMTLLAQRITEKISRVPLGVNVLRNDARSALAIAATVGAQFIRVNVHTGAMITDQGLIEGKAHQTLRYRSRLNSRVAIFADLLVKHAVPLTEVNIQQAARDTYHRGLADALILTGSRTGEEANIEDVEKVKAAIPEAFVFVGSGVTEENLPAMLRLANGVIVGTWLKKGGVIENEVDPKRVRALVRRRNQL